MGGGEHALYYMLKELNRSKFHPVMVFNQRGAFVDKIQSLEVETIFLPYRNVMLRSLIRPIVLWQTLNASISMYRFLKQKNVDVIQCSDVLSLMLIAFSVIRLRVPVLYSVIFFYEWSRMIAFNLLAVALASKIITNSSAVEQDMKRRTIFLAHKIETKYQGVNTELFRPRREGEVDVLRAELGIPQDVKLIGMVGRFDPVKGHMVFLHAAARILTQRQDVRFVVIGGMLFADVFPSFRTYHDEVMHCHSKLGLDKKVFFLPHRDDMPAVMRSFDVLVCPSINEGFSLVIVEAVASGIPVVASKTAGAVEVVQNVESVHIAETGDPDSFAQHITEALGMKSAAEVSPSASAVLKGLTWRGYAENMERVYASFSRT